MSNVFPRFGATIASVIRPTRDERPGLFRPNPGWRPSPDAEPRQVLDMMEELITDMDRVDFGNPKSLDYKFPADTREGSVALKDDSLFRTPACYFLTKKRTGRTSTDWVSTLVCDQNRLICARSRNGRLGGYEYKEAWATETTLLLVTRQEIEGWLDEALRKVNAKKADLPLGKRRKQTSKERQYVREMAMLLRDFDRVIRQVQKAQPQPEFSLAKA